MNYDSWRGVEKQSAVSGSTRLPQDNGLGRGRVPDHSLGAEGAAGLTGRRWGRRHGQYCSPRALLAEFPFMLFSFPPLPVPPQN